MRGDWRWEFTSRAPSAILEREDFEGVPMSMARISVAREDRFGGCETGRDEN